MEEIIKVVVDRVNEISELMRGQEEPLEAQTAQYSPYLAGVVSKIEHIFSLREFQENFKNAAGTEVV